MEEVQWEDQKKDNLRRKFYQKITEERDLILEYTEKKSLSAIKMIKNTTLIRKIIAGKFGCVSRIEDLDFYKIDNI